MNYKTNKDKREKVLSYQAKNQSKRLYSLTKSRSKKQGIEFDLTLEDFLIPSFCPILGIELTNIYGEGRVFSNASIDRIDSSKGYIKGNVQIISDLANRMKQNATPDQLIAFANGILKIYS